MNARVFTVIPFALFFGGHVFAAIPVEERAVLNALYAQTQGKNWINNSGWNGLQGSECTWYGVTCDASETHVLSVALPNNNLTGTLPDISGLEQLTNFSVRSNHISGEIPDISNMKNIWNFIVNDNRLTGSIPNLPKTNLAIDVSYNKLTGSIPSLSGLRLDSFYANHNGLTGNIPDMSGLSALYEFDVSENMLTGSIPNLSGAMNLEYFNVALNQLTGSIPQLSNLIGLQTFNVRGNQIAGSIPSLQGLKKLRQFSVRENHLAGQIPSLAGLDRLELFYVSNNLLSGVVPAVPSPTNSLVAGQSLLCPNNLTPTADANWNVATSNTPWYSTCSSLPNMMVTPSAGIGGTITPDSPLSVTYGSTPEFHVAPLPGFKVIGISGSCGGDFSGTTFVTTAVTYDCTVAASFAPVVSTDQVVSAPVSSPYLWAILIVSLGGATLCFAPKRMGAERDDDAARVRRST
ncbi:MAG: hypothetical protein JSS42_08240 [Proteobacteria bacterium]|nr:hypothetical protein [Pseudomonadota bacterium]